MDRWNRAAHTLTHHAGSKHAFVVVVVLVVAWLAVGAVAGSSRAWELVVTCGVPILTLLTVVVLQHTQNRDTKATQLKLNELLLALEESDSTIVHAGRLGDEELDQVADDHSARVAEEAGGVAVDDA